MFTKHWMHYNKHELKVIISLNAVSIGGVSVFETIERFANVTSNFFTITELIGPATYINKIHSL